MLLFPGVTQMNALLQSCNINIILSKTDEFFGSIYSTFLLINDDNSLNDLLPN